MLARHLLSEPFAKQGPQPAKDLQTQWTDDDGNNIVGVSPGLSGECFLDGSCVPSPYGDWYRAAFAVRMVDEHGGLLQRVLGVVPTPCRR